MSNAELIDLALCGGYVYEENICDCCGHDTSRWVKAEMPVMGCMEEIDAMLCEISGELNRRAMQMIANSITSRMADYAAEFKPHTKTGMTINVKRPERWKQ